MQLALFGREPPRFDPSLRGVVRRELSEGAWVEHLPGWLAGHAVLFEELHRDVAWAETTQVLYDKEVQTPRLVAVREGRAFPILDAMADALSEHVGRRLDRVSFALYRDGKDSVAFHRDKVLREQDEAVMATVSVGEPRPFLLRPRAGGQPSVRFELGYGDLIIMGGTCQRTWEHAVPKVKRTFGPRIAIMFRPVELPAMRRLDEGALGEGEGAARADELPGEGAPAEDAPAEDERHVA